MDLTAHRNKLITQKTQILAEIALRYKDLDMVTGAIQSVDILLKEQDADKAVGTDSPSS